MTHLREFFREYESCSTKHLWNDLWLLKQEYDEKIAYHKKIISIDFDYGWIELNHDQFRCQNKVWELRVIIINQLMNKKDFMVDEYDKMCSAFMNSKCDAYTGESLCQIAAYLQRNKDVDFLIFCMTDKRCRKDNIYTTAAHELHNVKTPYVIRAIFKKLAFINQSFCIMDIASILSENSSPESEACMLKLLDRIDKADYESRLFTAHTIGMKKSKRCIERLLHFWDEMKRCEDFGLLDDITYEESLDMFTDTLISCYKHNHVTPPKRLLNYTGKRKVVTLFNERRTIK